MKNSTITPKKEVVKTTRVFYEKRHRAHKEMEEISLVVKVLRLCKTRNVSNIAGALARLDLSIDVVGELLSLMGMGLSSIIEEEDIERIYEWGAPRPELLRERPVEVTALVKEHLGEFTELLESIIQRYGITSYSSINPMLVKLKKEYDDAGTKMSEIRSVCKHVWKHRWMDYEQCEICEAVRDTTMLSGRDKYGD